MKKSQDYVDGLKTALKETKQRKIISNDLGYNLAYIAGLRDMEIILGAMISRLERGDDEQPYTEVMG